MATAGMSMLPVPRMTLAQAVHDPQEYQTGKDDVRIPQGRLERGAFSAERPVEKRPEDQNCGGEDGPQHHVYDQSVEHESIRFRLAAAAERAGDRRGDAAADGAAGHHLHQHHNREHHCPTGERVRSEVGQPPGLDQARARLCQHHQDVRPGEPEKS